MIDELIARALAEDIGDGDMTCAAVVPPEARAHATVSAKQAGVLAGVEVAARVFATVDPGIDVCVVRGDASPVEMGDAVLELDGPAASILSAERVALNFLGRLSGVATATRALVDAVEGTSARILDTRKTTPGLRALEKAAVVAGGGVSHRAGLYDAILIKENHVRVTGGVAEAARRGLTGAPEGVWVEIEVESLEELDEALEAGVQRILLDNMSPEQLTEAVARAGGRATLEASGGIGRESIRAVAESGVDYISVGALTHSAPALDVSLLVDPA